MSGQNASEKLLTWGPKITQRLLNLQMTVSFQSIKHKTWKIYFNCWFANICIWQMLLSKAMRELSQLHVQFICWHQSKAKTSIIQSKWILMSLHQEQSIAIHRSRLSRLMFYICWNANCTWYCLLQWNTLSIFIKDANKYLRLTNQLQNK